MMIHFADQTLNIVHAVAISLYFLFYCFLLSLRHRIRNIRMFLMSLSVLSSSCRNIISFTQTFFWAVDKVLTVDITFTPVRKWYPWAPASRVHPLPKFNVQSGNPFRNRFKREYVLIFCKIIIQRYQFESGCSLAIIDALNPVDEARLQNANR